MKLEPGVNWRKSVMSLGQHGGIGGSEWDDGVFPFIKRVEISYDYYSIVSIRTQYRDDNGILTWSEKNGGNYNTVGTGEVSLDCPNEYLISIHGWMGKDYRGHYLVKSLTFESNKKSYGPFGEERGERFWFPTTGCKVVGFHGASGWFLDSIGIKIVPLQNNTNTPS